MGERNSNIRSGRSGKGGQKRSVAHLFRRAGFKTPIVVVLFLLFFFLTATTARAGEDLYRNLSLATKGKGDVALIKKFNDGAKSIDWAQASVEQFEGNLRLLKAETIIGTEAETHLFLVRNINGEIHLLFVPSAEERTKDKVAFYIGLEKMLEGKMSFRVEVKSKEINGTTYSFARFVDAPQQLRLDRIFKVSIVLMLSLVMLGMGLTLTVKDFQIVFQKPRGMLAGSFLQWVIMPLVAVGVGHLFGFYKSFPFIYVGFVLITVSPGGVTSNLMTYYAKGDVALSISLTSLSTVLSLIFTPLLLTLYCANLPEVTMPVKLVVQTIIVLVIIPLALGMLIRFWKEAFAKKAIPLFSALGVIALLFLIVAGLISNLEMFADTTRYNFTFYAAVFLLTLLGMLAGGIFPKLIGINNYQARAISLETGLRNASLAMAIALLLQDYMGDFYISMFFTSGIFGLWMYVAGFLSIAIFKKALPLEEQVKTETPC